jgi:hypothetical protein
MNTKELKRELAYRLRERRRCAEKDAASLRYQLRMGWLNGEERTRALAILKRLSTVR